MIILADLNLLYFTNSLGTTIKHERMQKTANRMWRHISEGSKEQTIHLKVPRLTSVARNSEYPTEYYHAENDIVSFHGRPCLGTGRNGNNELWEYPIFGDWNNDWPGSHRIILRRNGNQATFCGVITHDVCVLVQFLNINDADEKLFRALLEECATGFRTAQKTS